MLRIGIGYDIHRLEKGRRLVIGGVEIPYEYGLYGHSDADVLIHAIIDAMLGAAGEPDIGNQFPDTDPAYHSVSSLTLLEKTSCILNTKNLTIVNIDSIIIAERPKMAQYIPAMREIIATTLNISDLSCINIKAKTNEKIGTIGREEGIAAQACILAEKK